MGASKVEYISVRQAVQRLNGAVGKSLIYSLIATGRLRATRLMGKILIDAGHLDELLIAGLTGPRPEPPAPPAAKPAPLPDPIRKRRIKLW